VKLRRNLESSRYASSKGIVRDSFRYGKGRGGLVDGTGRPLLGAGHVLASNETELNQEQQEKNRQSCSSDLHLRCWNSFPRIAPNM
jgi:hypothetical protein